MNTGSLARTWPTVVSGLVLAAGLAIINTDIRTYFARLASGAASAELTAVGWRVRDAGWAVVQAVKDQSVEHGPLMVFAVAATVLVVFMLRT